MGEEGGLEEVQEQQGGLGAVSAIRVPSVTSLNPLARSGNQACLSMDYLEKGERLVVGSVGEGVS